jgi:hydrogenase nickel incorporation protein HypA/HybF
MHELSLMEDLVETISERLGEARVVHVRLEVGKLAGVMPDSLRFCFDVCVRGSTLEGAELEILELAGHELRLKDVEVA